MSRQVIFSAHIRIDFERTLWDAAEGHLKTIPTVPPSREEIERVIGHHKQPNVENCLKIVLSGKIAGCTTLAVDCTERSE